MNIVKKVKGVRPTKQKLARLFSLKHLQKLTWHTIARIFVYLILLEFAFVFLFPYATIIINSIKSPMDFMDVKSNFIVKYPTFMHYRALLENKVFNYEHILKMTSLITLAAVFGQVISCSFVGYGLTRFKFKGRRLILVLIVLTLIIPPQVFSIPTFYIIRKLGLPIINTPIPIVLPAYLAGGLRGSLFIFIFMQNYLQLPKELEESARIDGSSAFHTFRKIILPNTKASILVTVILSIVWHWNDYFQPSIYYTDPRRTFLTSAFTMITRDDEGFIWKKMYLTGSGVLVNPQAMAAAILVLFPVIVLYLILQRRFMASIEHTGMK